MLASMVVALLTGVYCGLLSVAVYLLSLKGKVAFLHLVLLAPASSTVVRVRIRLVLYRLRERAF